jgi:GNAT superfamily N-acetyltransferase
MTEGASAEAETANSSERGWKVREALADDAPAVAAAVGELLVELSGDAPSAAKLEGAARELAGNRQLGALLVAEAGEEPGLAGVLAASWQHAIHIPGRYGTIQDLWVRPGWRSRAVGAELLGAFLEIAREQGIDRIEVGLPREGFAGIDATESFYRSNGFQRLGPRMRRTL